MSARPLWNLPAIRAARASCEAGEARACLALGRTFAGAESDSISSDDWAEAKHGFALACETGAPAGCFELGELHLTGRGHAKDLDQARAAFALACDAGSSAGCERHELIDLPLKGCNDGDGLACGELAATLTSGTSVLRDQNTAQSFWERACDLSSEACREAGDAFRLGEGLAADLERAVEFYRRGSERDFTKRYDAARLGCEAEQPNACLQLGDLFYGDPAGTPLEPEAARLRYERGCEHGSGEACMRVVDRFATDRRGLPTAAAAHFARAACDAEYGAGCTLVGNLIARSTIRGTESSMRDAYSQGCARGDGEACYRLGLALRADSKDAKEADAFVERACTLRYDAACE